MDSTNNERATARADGAVWAVNRDREAEAIGHSDGDTPIVYCLT